MDITTLAPDVHLAVGKTYASNSTVFVRGDEALLIDGMGSRADAEELQRWLEWDLGKTVRFIISSHYFADHMAAFRLFPRAELIAHALHLHTWTTERFRSQDEEQHFATPSITFEDRLTIRWGAYTLELFHNPGHTMSTIGIDVAGADLLHVGDTIVGNIAYLSYSTPELMAGAIERARRRNRRLVLTSHGPARDSIALTHAASYLHALGEKATRSSDEEVKSIALDDCMPAGVRGTEHENKFHLRNLDSIVEKKFFRAAC